MHHRRASVFAIIAVLVVACGSAWLYHSSYTWRFTVRRQRTVAQIREIVAGRAVPSAQYASTKGLADGSADAVAAQRHAVERHGLPLEILLTNAGVVLRLVPEGAFEMGSFSNEPNSSAAEQPRHRAWITAPFYIGTCEVTRDQWQRVMGWFPPQPAGLGSNHPAAHVTLGERNAFLHKLSTMESIMMPAGSGRVLRLPTEAEWEYACRAGTTAMFCHGDNIDARHARFGTNMPVTVGSFPPNAWGIHDMHGNVAETCADRYDSGFYRRLEAVQADPVASYWGSEQAVRGGSYAVPIGFCRSASRSWLDHNVSNNIVGFRIVLGAPVP